MNKAIEQLSRNEATYKPAETFAEGLSEVIIAPLIGVVAVGKSTCINGVTRISSEFGKVQGFTTRPRRPGESEEEYRFLTHQEDTIRHIADMASRGELIQYALHPTGYIYGTNITDYNQPYMLIDVMAHSVDRLRRLPFRKMTEITLVTTPIEWLERYASRSTGLDETIKRIREGRQSLAWSLDQGPSMAWVSNESDKLDEVSEEIRGLVMGKREPNPQNRKTGERLLRTFNTLLDF